MVDTPNLYCRVNPKGEMALLDLAKSEEDAWEFMTVMFTDDELLDSRDFLLDCKEPWTNCWTAKNVRAFAEPRGYRVVKVRLEVVSDD